MEKGKTVESVKEFLVSKTPGIDSMIKCFNIKVELWNVCCEYVIRHGSRIKCQKSEEVPSFYQCRKEKGVGVTKL